ncbi:SdiA-regulated domain-containing protein [Pseudomonas sp.]|uniref:SdiA-regulated domain-containing protein n=1 Tax=Pseudomonas sp. TaxID=306 RepID=UPI0028B0D646|nr:SdiA-regulated domain-containing protein [Pseudomonas sp.]
MPSPSSPSLASPLRARAVWRRWPFWLVAAAVLGIGLARLMHWDDRGLLWIKENLQSPAERHESVWLPDYVADIDAKVLDGIGDDEASDLAFNPLTRTLFSVMGKHSFLVELSLDGDVLRKMPLRGWDNPEGVAVLEDGQIAITDERQHSLVLVKVDAHTTELNRADFTAYDLGTSADDNKGFEGIAWDPHRQRLVIGEERPPQLYGWDTSGHGPLTGSKYRLPSGELDLRNLSALAVDPRTHHLLVLSADSNMLLELDEQGKQVSFMTLLGGFNGLGSRIPRAEGVTMDEHGTLYMVSEPDLFYRFKKN